ncbi:MAG: VWA domain-containing protein [Acidobacteria bacterium]|nr:VWA domain-containing protein [Acidobacteriota bacterium]
MTWIFSPSLFLLLLTQAPDPIRVDATFVKVPVTVLDARGEAVRQLLKEDFQLVDEGEHRAIENFVIEETPLNVVLLLDISGSTVDELAEFKESAYDFTRALSRKDRVSIVSFDNRVHVIQSWTNKPDKIHRSLSGIEQGYRTALYDAVSSVAATSFAGISGRRVIIVLTDGIDNESRQSHGAVLERLIQSSTSLYIISRSRTAQNKIEDSERVEFLNRVMQNVLGENRDYVELYFKNREKLLTDLAETTGGRVLFPEKLEDLKPSYTLLARELKNQYLLTFRPPRASKKKFRQIQVRCMQPVKRIFHRRQYAVP